MSSLSSTAGHKRSATEAALVESDRDYLQFTPLGGGCEVGRSCHILQFKGKTIMLDCGLHPAYSGIASLPYFDEINPADIDIILITHFHLDHAAALPYFLEKTAFRGRVFMTHPTKSVYKLILQDYVKVSSISVEETLYTERDLLASMDRIECVNYHQVVEHKGVKLWAYNAGHVLGAAMFMLEIGGVRILYTGDYSRTEDRHLMAAELPLPSLYPHVLIIEATYGTQTLRPVEEREGRFCSLVQEIVEERGGSCLIPVFALGRAQELLLILDEYWEAHPSLQAVPIYYASFLAKKCMTVYQTYLNMMNAHIQRQAQLRNPFHFKYVFNVRSLSDFDDSAPCVILASPGMLQNGVSRELLEMWCSDAKNGVIIAGYAVEGTLAKHIMTEPTHITSVGGARLPLRMSVNYISFSAHADYRETSEFIDALKPAHCILVHGDVNEGVGKLKAALIDRYGASMNCQGPKNGQTVELEFKQTKVVKTVGRLAEGEDGAEGETGGGVGVMDGRVMKGVIVRKDFVYTFMAVEDLPNFTPINCTSIKQTLLVPFHHTFAAFRTFIQQLFIPDSDDDEEDDDGDAGEEEATAGATEKAGTGVKKEKVPQLRIHRSVIGRWYVGRVELEWESSPVDDMIADSVVSLLTSVQATVGGAKMIGVSHQHGEKDVDFPTAPTAAKVEVRGVKKEEEEEEEEEERKVQEEDGDVDSRSTPSSPSSASSSPTPRSPSPSLLFALELQYGALQATEAAYVVTVDGSTASIDRATLDVQGEDEVLVKRVRASVVRWEGSRGGGVRERWASEEVGWRMEELEARLKVDDPANAVLGI